MKTVLVVQASLQHYRIAFFERLHDALRAENMRLRVAYGKPRGADGDAGAAVTGDLPFGMRTTNYWLLGGRLLLQPLGRAIMGADLVIVEQANKHLVNYLLLVLSLLGVKKVAFWGHGWNRQRQRPNSLAERIKARLARLPDWWFAYTGSAARFLAENGVRTEVVTVVQNSLDVKSFQDQLSAITGAELERARPGLELRPESVVGLYCGRLYRDKDIPFLLRAAAEIRTRLPDFHLVIIGDGPDRETVQEYAEEKAWVHYVGARLGREKALYFRLARIFLHPGAMGLGILDAFASGLPVVTTDISRHGPEIDFLESGRNGVMSPHALSDYADAVVRVLSDPLLHCSLSDGALASADKYSLDTMVENFTRGIVQCLAHGA